jgi:hypothetical protein
MRLKDPRDLQADPETRYYRMTARGALAAEDESTLKASRYLHDVLLMCRTSICLQELRQFVPPRSLQQSLHSLQSLGLIESYVVEPPAPSSLPAQSPAWERTDYSELRSA